MVTMVVEQTCRPSDTQDPRQTTYYYFFFLLVPAASCLIPKKRAHRTETTEFGDICKRDPN